MGSYSRRTETIAALLDDVAVASAAAALISFILYKAGVIGLAAMTIAVAVTGGVVAVIAVLVYRTHSRRPQVGPEALVGLRARAFEGIPPRGEGFVVVEGELWRLVNVGETPINPGDKVLIVGQKGLTLMGVKMERGER